MLTLLLDENLSYQIAEGVNRKRPDLLVHSVHTWEAGRLRGVPDREILLEAAEAGLTLVTYDVNTIPLLLMQLGDEGFSHGGVVFVSQATFRSDDYGGLVTALIRVQEDEGEADWRDRVYFLPSPRRE